jgi:peptidyl-prolyl cis-trans isomerase SurA
MKRRLPRAVLGATALAMVLSVLGAAPARAQGSREVIERVVAVVNDEAVLLSELRRRAVPFLEQAMQGASEVERMARLEQLYNQLLDAIIDEELIQQAARDMQVRVTTEDVDRAIDNVRQQSQLSDNEFWQAVRAQGFTETQYRSDVRRQLLKLKVLNTRARGRVNITEEDVRGRYRQLVREMDSGSCFEVSTIVTRVADGASATDIATARSAALALKERATPQNFAELGGVDIGRVCEGDLHPALTQALAGMRAGQISEPIRGPNGFYLLYVRGRAASNVPPYDQVKQQIFQRMMEEAMQSQERIFLDELRRKAVIDRRL